MDSVSLAKQFVTAYYTTIQQNKLGLIQFYNDLSSMTYGGERYVGIKDIQEKIESLGFQKIVYSIDDLDVQNGPIQNSFMIFVTGTLCMDDENTYKFSQVFNILSNNQGGYYCHNDIFRLVF